jgi:hypothetical protein
VVGLLVVPRLLRRVAGCALVVAAAGVTMVLVEEPDPVDRLGRGAGVGVAVGAEMALLPVIGEQHREAMEAVMAEIYRQLG